MCQKEHVDSTVCSESTDHLLHNNNRSCQHYTTGKKIRDRNLVDITNIKKFVYNVLEIAFSSVILHTVLSVHSVCCRSFSLSRSLYPSPSWEELMKNTPPYCVNCCQTPGLIFRLRIKKFQASSELNIVWNYFIKDKDMLHCILVAK